MLASGDDEYTLPVTLAGGSGVISVIGQAYPKEFSQMVALAKEGKVKEAYRIHNSLVEITRLIFAEGNPAGIKAVLAKKESSRTICVFLWWQPVLLWRRNSTSRCRNSPKRRRYII